MVKTKKMISSSFEEAERMQIEKAQTADDRGQVEIGNLYRGALSAEESTWVVFRAEKNRTYRIETSRLTGSIDTTMVLYSSPHQTRLASDDDGGSEELASMIELTPDISGPYLLKISNLNEKEEEGQGQGKYDLKITLTEGVPAGPD